MLGVANRPGGYDGTLITFLAPFLNTCAGLLNDLRTSKRKEEVARYQRSETALLRAILDNVPDGVLTIDTDGLIETVNPAAELLLGYSASEITGRSIQTFLREQYRANIESLLQSAVHDTISSLGEITEEIVGHRKDGSLFPAELSLNKFCVNDRTLFTVIIRDETERRRAQLSLQESEQHLLKAQALAQVGSLTWHLDVNMQKWSEQLYRLFGFRPGAIDPGIETIKQIIHPEDAETTISTIETGLERYDWLQLEFRIIRPNGEIRYIHGRAAIDRGPDQAALRMHAAFTDITAERLATHSHKILTYAIDHGMEGLALLDHEGRYTYMNPAHADIYGYSVQELIGKTWRELYAPKEIERIERDIFPQLIQNNSWTGESMGRKKSGENFYVEISLRLLAGPMASGSEFLICTCRDITARKRTEAIRKEYNEALEARVLERTAELAAANVQLRKLSQDLIRTQENERRRIATDLHDEIGQALTALNINLQVLQQEYPDHRTIEDSLRLSEDILAQVRKLAVDLRPQLLDEFGIEVAVRIYAERQAERNGWTLTFHLDGDWHSCADETTVTCFRIIQESLTNTARHAKANSVTVRLTFLESTVNLIVKDDGIGFTPHQTSSDKAINGTGLKGMRERIELAGGTLTLTTSPGHGTHIRAEIPIIRKLA